ncbi:MAG: ABC transporter ATP-binding protein [Anaerolineales bacterium]|nr:ABC transporter ATP-binding protein [Anaerolineales bacterium]
MSGFALRVEDLSKRYRIGAPPKSANGGQAVLGRLAAPFRYLASTFRPPAEDEILWALRGVSFEVRPGEVIGVIGRNGAGKSTLLKILSRITEPTSGRAIIAGRVGSLLEVGTGFHPELTGRENIYLSGAVLGMRRTEIARKFDEIVAFAETEKFLDTPVKRYSSGMYVRLAFAVAAHLEPEVLLVDEVLAVGDAAFQQKCLGKMGNVATQGRTVVFVSHNLVAVQGLCQRAIWLHNGRMAGCGETAQLVSEYLSAARHANTAQMWPEPSAAPGNDKVRLHRLSVRPRGGTPADPITMETPLAVEVEYWSLSADAHLGIRWRFVTEQQAVAFTTASSELSLENDSQPLPPGLYRSVCYVPSNLLNEGLHHLTLLVVRNAGQVIFRLDEALTFDVLNSGARPGFRYSREQGAVRPLLDWTTQRVGDV